MSTYIPDTLFASKATSKATRDARREYENLRERDRLHVRAVAAAERELEAANARETEDAAKALRAGGAMPTSNLNEQRSQLEEMRREAAALELAVKASETALEEAIANNRPAWEHSHNGASGARRNELVAALDALAAAHERLRESLAVDAHLAGPGTGRHRVGPITLTRASGDALSPADLLGALRTYAAGDDDQAVGESPAVQHERRATRDRWDVEMLRWNVQNGGTYGDSVSEIRTRYLERGPRAAEAARELASLGARA